MTAHTKTITIRVTDHQYDKLGALARARGLTIQECIRRFAETCQPGGGDWVSPMKTEAKGDA